MTMRLLGLLPLALSMTVFGCTTSEGEPPLQDEEVVCSDPGTAGCVVSSELKRDTSPAVAPADLKAAADGNRAFAFDLYQQLREESGNLFYSPHSISSALAMTWAGARAQTEQDMAAALHFTLPQAQLHPAFNAIDLALESRGKGAQGSDGKGFRLTVANALWGQINFPFEADFLDVLARNYGAGMHVVDFVEQPTEATDLINGWVDHRTEGKIKKLLTPQNIRPNTRLVLTNAIYFNAAWATPFEPSQTQDGPFVTQAGAQVTVPMMHGYLQVPYGEGAGFKAVELPYDGHELSMVLVLPDNLDAFEQGLDAARVDGVVGALGTRLVDTKMPRFKFESRFSMVDPLAKLGMGIAFGFDGEPDFSGINGTGGLAIDEVVHQAFVGVNEAGTEAAAATAVIVGETSAPEPAEISLDRPFVFFIRDIATGAVLFVGRVSDPSPN
ncbi:serpin family protein [Chondromyces crocatus]|uniref:Serpin domain-containing protein n=1 Tax=Chondromyces crocatus TaxID=52 RepID=A0A0K1E9P2_CHOCO|nr:serpin family protein [Chondromyces crocatus]AKT37591.1 uncharacterized protein CMC5_017320 [Chondromyces crocatus]